MSAEADRAAHGQPSRRAFETTRLRLARMSAGGTRALTTVFHEATKLVAQTLGVERVGIWLFVEQRRAMRTRTMLAG